MLSYLHTNFESVKAVGFLGGHGVSLVKISKIEHNVTSKFPVRCVNAHVVWTAYDVPDCLKRKFHHKFTRDPELPVASIFLK